MSIGNDETTTSVLSAQMRNTVDQRAHSKQPSYSVASSIFLLFPLGAGSRGVFAYVTVLVTT